MSQNASPQPEWEERPDGSRVRFVNGIRIVDRGERGASAPGPMEQLVAREEEGGLVILGLDAHCRVVYSTMLARRR